MRQLRAALVLLVLALISSSVCRSQSFDLYSGRTDVKCQNTTGWFHPEKLGNRWWLCTPEGHGLFLQGVGAWQSPAAPKYGGNPCSTASALTAEFLSWGFNSVGELSDQHVEPTGPCQSAKKLPEVHTLNVSNYAAANLWNYARHPMKNLSWGLNANYSGWRASTMDFFEPDFAVWLDGFFATDQAFLAYKKEPSFVGIFLDDTDWFWGMGAGPDYHTVPPGKNNSDVGYIVLITSPVQTFDPDPASRGIPIQYSDTKVYSKTAAPSPPLECSIQTPCSLRDYLYKKYNGSIAALNAAWGSDYTTFDSAGTQVSNEQFAEGDGTKTVFEGGLSHHPISPETVIIKINGSPRAADCPSFQPCNVNSGGAIIGLQGGEIVSGVSPWARDSQMSARDCGGCGLPPASYWFRLVWHMKPGFHSSPSRIIGETYHSGSPQITITADNATPLDPNATGIDIYVSCRVSSGPASHGCVAANAPEPSQTLQAENVPFPSGFWQEPASGLVSGAPLPGAPGTIDYASGQVRITLAKPLARGQKLSVDYISGGWMYGSGLMDEDGRHKKWVGTNPVCLSPAVACDGRDEPKADANPQVAADLDAWTAQFSSQYFGTLSRHLKRAAPHMLYFGADTVGTWDAPPRKEILQGAAPFVDGLFTLWFANQNEDQAKYKYITQYLGDKPLMNFMTLHAQPDSAMSDSPNGNCCFGLRTQQARGQQWYDIIQSMLNTPSYNNTYQWVGIVWWGSHDFTNEKTNWGLKTPSDNAYDGHEDVTAIVPCSPPLEKFRCGGEKKNYGDAISLISKANRLWLQLPARQ